MRSGCLTPGWFRALTSQPLLSRLTSTLPGEEGDSYKKLF